MKKESLHKYIIIFNYLFFFTKGIKIMFICFSFKRTLQKFYLRQPVELTPLRNSFESHHSILSGHFLLLSHQYYLKTNSTVLNYIHDLLQLRVPIKTPSASRIIFKKQYNVCIQNMSGKNYCTQLFFFSGKIFFLKKEMAEREQFVCLSLQTYP